MVQKFDINFDTSKIHIDLDGSLLADAIALIVKAFKTKILKAIANVIDQEVPPLVEESINEEITKSMGYAYIYDDVTLDFSLPVDPVVVNDTLELYINGTIFDWKEGYKVPSTPITELDVDIT